MQDFYAAAQTYEQLIAICPSVEEYRVYYAQSLYKTGLYPEAIRACARIHGEQHAQQITLLQACIKYEQDELQTCKSLLDTCVQDDPDIIVNYGCVAYKEVRCALKKQTQQPEKSHVHLRALFLATVLCSKITREQDRSSKKRGPRSGISLTSSTTWRCAITSRSSTRRP